MKNICLLLSVILIFSSCSWLQNKNTVVSKYTNDTLYTITVKSGEKIVLMNDEFESVYKPNKDEMLKKALITSKVADEWIKKGSSNNISINSKSSLTVLAWILICLGVVVLGIIIWFIRVLSSGAGPVFKP